MDFIEDEAGFDEIQTHLSETIIPLVLEPSQDLFKIFNEYSKVSIKY